MRQRQHKATPTWCLRAHTPVKVISTFQRLRAHELDQPLCHEIAILPALWKKGTRGQRESHGRVKTKGDPLRRGTRTSNTTAPLQNLQEGPFFFFLPLGARSYPHVPHRRAQEKERWRGWGGGATAVCAPEFRVCGTSL